ncbi:MAG: hypothetical protein GY924_26000 [Planctomycetaceae bacterium]|nr:hypothetical protein [Planctomycetaceae bacterium]
MDRQPPRALFTLLISLAVFTIAVLLRLPSCYESLWLDELHSAWIVADGVGSVYQRSVLGHQSPCYYLQLWAWKQLLGDSEFMLRLNSVLLVASGCSVIAYGITKWTSSLLAGLVSGLILAVENNSLFFGTELRPFALVILCSSISIILFLQLLSSESRHQRSGTWCFLIVTVLFSTICQPTSLGVLAWLPLGLCGYWLIRNPREFRRITWLDATLIAITGLAMLMLWQMTLGQSWAEKSMWGSFATATHWQQIWTIWDWPSLLLIPVISALLILIIDNIIDSRKQSDLHRSPILIGLGFLATLSLLATTVYWCLSSFEVVPVWHRRYFIAVLPVLACFAGSCIGYVQIRLAGKRKSTLTGFALAFTILLCLETQQRTWQRLQLSPVALVTRGENWREAIEWLQQESESECLILLDSGLIEGQSWITPELFEIENSAKLEYLCFPLRGPYHLDREVIPVGPSFQPVTRLADAKRPTYILTRNTVKTAKRRVAANEVLGFGRVAVVLPVKQASPREKERSNER